MKKILTVLTIFILTLTLVSCKSNKENTITVGTSFEPVTSIFKLIKEDLKEDGYNLVIKEQGLQVNNLALEEKELDANFIQHANYLNQFNNANNSNLVIVKNIYHATYALYSSEYTKLDDIPNGSNITLINDVSNISRALYLLDQAGLIKVNDNKKDLLTEEDIIENNKNLTFNEKSDLDTIAQKYKETKLAVMYPTNAKSLELVGNEQRLYVEVSDSITNGFAISVAAREDNKDSIKIQVLLKHLTSEKVRNYLINEYGWASTPAF